MRDEIMRKINEAFLEGIARFDGEQTRDAVRRDGLAQMHRHFPVEKVRLLEDYLLKKLKDDLYYWSYAVCKENLCLSDEFYVDNLIMFRIHYPYLIAKQAGKVLDPPYPWHIKVKAALSDFKNWRMFVHRFRDFKKNTLGRWLGILDETNSYTPEKYHQHVPRPARAHGAHIDTWYGHSFDGVNLWLAVDGVNEDNTVILYPEMFGHPVQYDPVSMYLKPGIPLPKPTKLKMNPGQLLVFNPETLHGTQVNISDETRVAITTRINPETPRFNVNAGFHFQHWHASSDLAAGHYSKLSVFPASQYSGKPSIPDKISTLIQKTMRLRSSQSLKDGEVTLCDSGELRPGEKMAVDLRDEKLLVVRTRAGLRVFGRICPHRGIDLIDGYHDDQAVYCPGHGVAYSLETGESACEAFKLRGYTAYDKDGRICISKAEHVEGKQSAIA